MSFELSIEFVVRSSGSFCSLVVELSSVIFWLNSLESHLYVVLLARDAREFSNSNLDEGS